MCPFWDSKDKGREGLWGGRGGLNDLLIKPRTQGNSLRAFGFVVDTTGSDNPGLNSPAAQDGLNVNHLNFIVC